MSPFTARTVLEVWETGTRQHPVDRALTLLAAAGPERSRQALADLRLGERDGRLLALYEALFGSEMVGFARCPECGERLEVPLSVPELRREVDRAVDAPDELASGGIELRFRPLTSRDLAAAVLAADGARARRLLGERAVVEAWRDATPIAPAELPAAVIDDLAVRLAECDPGAEIRLELDCPVCRHEWSTLLDVGELLWTELGVVAGWLLRDVGVLARAYHWSESEILAMSPARRRAYLEMLEG